MTEVYGHKWTSSYGDEPCDTWARGLHDVSAADLGVALRRCVESGEAWPPSLAEFRALCKPPARENARMYAFPAERQLPHKLTDEQRAKGSAAIAALKSRLR